MLNIEVGTLVGEHHAQAQLKASTGALFERLFGGRGAH
jgi:hypothetical protein